MAKSPAPRPVRTPKNKAPKPKQLNLALGEPYAPRAAHTQGDAAVAAQAAAKAEKRKTQAR